MGSFWHTADHSRCMELATEYSDSAVILMKRLGVWCCCSSASTVEPSDGLSRRFGRVRIERQCGQVAARAALRPSVGAEAQRPRRRSATRQRRGVRRRPTPNLLLPSRSAIPWSCNRWTVDDDRLVPLPQATAELTNSRNWPRCTRFGCASTTASSASWNGSTRAGTTSASTRRRAASWPPRSSTSPSASSCPFS